MGRIMERMRREGGDDALRVNRSEERINVEPATAAQVGGSDVAQAAGVEAPVPMTPTSSSSSMSTEMRAASDMAMDIDALIGALDLLALRAPLWPARPLGRACGLVPGGVLDFRARWNLASHEQQAAAQRYFEQYAPRLVLGAPLARRDVIADDAPAAEQGAVHLDFIGAIYGQIACFLCRLCMKVRWAVLQRVRVPVF